MRIFKRSAPWLHGVLLAGTLALLLAVIPSWRAFADSVNYALRFDGTNDLVELPATQDILGTGWQSTKTVSFWMKPTGQAKVCANSSVGFCDAVFGDRPRWWGVSRGVINGNDRIWVFNSDGSPTTPADILSFTYTPGEWLHLSIVHGGGVLRVYKNGVEIASTLSGPTQQPNTGALPKLQLGGIINNTSRVWTFEGELDEVSLWNVARSAAEIQQDMFHALSGSEPGLRAYYAMSNGAGTTLTDDSSFAWDGILRDGVNGVPPNGNPPLWVPSDAWGGSTATPTSTPLPTLVVPTATPTPEAATATATSTATATATPTATATATPTATATHTATATPTFTPSSTPGITSTFTPTSPASSPTPGGSVNYALRFDGANDLVELPASSSVMGAGWLDTKTVSLWARPTGSAPTCANNLVSFCDAVFGDRPRGWGIARGVLNGMDRIWIWNSDSTSASTIDLVGVEYTPGEWVHLSLVHSQGTLRAYRNGVEIGSTPSGTTQQPTSGSSPKLHLGGVINSATRNWTFEGDLDEVSLWNVARTRRLRSSRTCSMPSPAASPACAPTMPCRMAPARPSPTTARSPGTASCATASTASRLTAARPSGSR